MKAVWKYTLDPGEQTIAMPVGAKVLSCHVHHGKPCLWALVYPDAPLILRRFLVKGTGHDIDQDLKLHFSGTILMRGGSLVYHVFEVIQ